MSTRRHESLRGRVREVMGVDGSREPSLVLLALPGVGGPQHSAKGIESPRWPEAR